MELHAGISEPVPIEILRRPGPDGKGGRVRMLIARNQANFDAGASASKGLGVVPDMRPVFRDLVRNFAKKPGPIAAYDDGHNVAGRKPQDARAFYVALHLRNDDNDLYADLDLTPLMWAALVDEGTVRGFSLEAKRNVKTPGGVVAGWLLTGGVFTNDPAMDVEVIAASWAGDVAEVRLTVALGSPQEARMAEKKPDELDALKAENEELKKKLAKFETKDKDDDKPAVAAETDDDKDKAMAAEFRTLQGQVDTVVARNLELESKLSARDATDEVRAALEAGKVTPGQLDSLAAAAGVEGGWKGNPVATLRKGYGSVESFSLTMEHQPVVVKVASTRGVTSGGGASNYGRPAQQLQAAVERLMAEKSIQFGEALEQISLTNPELHRRGLDDQADYMTEMNLGLGTED